MFISGLQMSVEGVSSDFDENSGEIQFSYCEQTMTVDNSDNGNSSLVLMGYPAEDIVSEVEPSSIFYNEIEETIDESAVIFNDIKSVEEWLRKRPEISLGISSADCDTIRNDDLLCFSGEETSDNYEEENTVLPNLSNDNSIEESNICSIHLDDLVLDSDNTTLKAKNYVLVPGTENNFEKEVELNRYEGIFSLSHNLKIVNSPKKTNVFENSFSSDSKSNRSLLEKSPLVNVNNETNLKLPTRPLCKSLPFIKIPKNCLKKGKILGKGDISLLSGKTPHSFFNHSKPLKNTSISPVPVLPNSNKHEQLKKPTVSLLKAKNCLKPLKQKPVRPNLNGEQPVMVLPIKSVSNSTKKSLLRLCHSRSILKNSGSNKSDKLSEKSSKNTDINVTHNISNSKQSIPVALVAISTNKSDNTTEIIIKTEDGENVFKGKTSDIMKATGSSIEHKPEEEQEKVKKRDKSHDEAVINNLMVELLGVSVEALDCFEGASSSNPLKCPMADCKYTTAKGSWLKTHILQHYGIRPFKCDYPDCMWAFYTNFRLKRHQEIHYKRKEHRCPVAGCGRVFSTSYNVNSHLKLHDRPTAVTCNINGCNRAFQTKRSYEKHLREHGVEHAPYICHKEGCGKKYFTINSLNSHSRIHQHNEEELKCSYCGKMFDQPCRLKAHINTHIGVKPYKCDYEGCMWAFTTSSKLRRHQRKHTQMRKHVCKICTKSFLRSEHLKDHSLKHFVKKSFICPLGDCGTVFSNKSSMYAHLKKHRDQETKMNEITSFPCPMDSCSLVFNTKESLRTHMQISHVLTGLMNNENSQDTIQLLSDDNLIALEGLQSNTPNSGPGVVSFNSMSQEGLLVGMSDLVQCIPGMEQGEYSESNSSNNIITHVVFTDQTDVENTDALEGPSELSEIEDNIGSARTGLPYQGGVGVKEKQPLCLSESGGESSGGLHSASDVVLSAGYDNLERSLLLQDELSGGDLYPSQEEGGLLGAAGELQVLLLDPTTREQTSDFEQSTINLRDLE